MRLRRELNESYRQAARHDSLELPLYPARAKCATMLEMDALIQYL